MTIFQPEKKNKTLTFALAGLICALSVGACALIGMYASVVSLEHDIAKTSRYIESLESNSSELRDEVFALSSGNRIGELAVQRGLITEREPRYVTIENVWSRASRY